MGVEGMVKAAQEMGGVVERAGGLGVGWVGDSATGWVEGLEAGWAEG
jgi:hypothetical protein